MLSEIISLQVGIVALLALQSFQKLSVGGSDPL